MTVPDDAVADEGSHARASVFALTIGAIGVVFGDIGTSPLYAVKEIFAGHHPLPLDRPHILGALSLIFWTVTLVVTVKYVTFVMRADNRGEGGSLALLARVSTAVADRPRLLAAMVGLGILGASLFYGDSMITPAISVLSAMEGLEIALPHLEPFILPMAVAILIGLFLIQRFGTEAVGRWFGPITLLWFVALAFLGLKAIAKAPIVLAALSPHYAILFMADNGLTGVLILGSVVLAVTGAEALYADMGHFGRLPIRLGWWLIAMPALMLNYFGQGALLLRTPEAIDNPFFRMAPPLMALPLVILATFATIIASQAVISGAFSVTRQAIQLGYLPRLTIVHTSKQEIGQIYIPAVNWTLAIAVVGLVLGFGSSANLASAYGVAVTGNMLITTLMLAVAMSAIWKWPRRRVMIAAGLLLFIDLFFFASTAVKIPDGGWFPLVVALVLFTVLTTWKMGRQRVNARLVEDAPPVAAFFAKPSDRLARVPGTAVYLTATDAGMPLALLHNLKHNKVLHELVVLLTVSVESVPVVAERRRLSCQQVAPGVLRLAVRCGFMESPNIPRILARAPSKDLGFFYEPMSISYFLSRETIVPCERDFPGLPDMPMWRKTLFAFLSRSATDALYYFRLPINRVVELGGQVEI